MQDAPASDPDRASRLFDDDDEVPMPEAAKPSITSIKPTSRDPARVTIRVGRKVAGTLDRTDANDLGLTVGQDWTPAVESRVAEAVAYDKARRAAWRLLQRRALSRGELIQRLKRKGHDPDVAARAADRLQELGYLDDESYARAVLRQLVLSKPAGPRLMRQKLRQRHIEPGLTDRVVAEFTDRSADDDAGREEEEHRIHQMLQRKLRSISGLDRATQSRRLYGFLARRGFEADTATRLVREALGKDLEDDG